MAAMRSRVFFYVLMLFHPGIIWLPERCVYQHIFAMNVRLHHIGLRRPINGDDHRILTPQFDGLLEFLHSQRFVVCVKGLITSGQIFGRFFDVPRPVCNGIRPVMDEKVPAVGIYSVGGENQVTPTGLEEGVEIPAKIREIQSNLDAHGLQVGL